MEKLKNILSIISVLMAGAIVTSLIMSKSDDWKIYLSVYVVCVGFLQYINNYEKT